MTSNDQIQIHKLPSSIESIAAVEGIVDRIREQHQIPEELYGNILVSLTEAANNSIRHGNQSDESKHIEIEFETNPKQLTFTIKDQGKGFDFNNVPDPTLEENIDKPFGRGIFIMKSLSDDVEFENEGSIVRLIFNR